MHHYMKYCAMLCYETLGWEYLQFHWLIMRCNFTGSTIKIARGLFDITGPHGTRINRMYFFFTPIFIKIIYALAHSRQGWKFMCFFTFRNARKYTLLCLICLNPSSVTSCTQFSLMGSTCASIVYYFIYCILVYTLMLSSFHQIFHSFYIQVEN